MWNELNEGKTFDEVTPFYAKHKAAEDNGLKQVRVGWSEIKYKYPVGYRQDEESNLEKAYGHKYNKHNEDKVLLNHVYYSPKELDDYYEKSVLERLKLQAKSKVSFVRDFWVLFGMAAASTVLLAAWEVDQILTFS